MDEALEKIDAAVADLVAAGWGDSPKELRDYYVKKGYLFRKWGTNLEEKVWCDSNGKPVGVVVNYWAMCVPTDGRVIGGFDVELTFCLGDPDAGQGVWHKLQAYGMSADGFAAALPGVIEGLLRAARALRGDRQEFRAGN